MTDELLRSGDQAVYNPAFGPATVAVSPGTLTGTGPMVNVGKAAVCVEGDEASATVPGCSYSVPGSYTIFGAGTLSITQLAADQLSTVTRAGGKPIMLKGSTFIAKFQVTLPAQMPTPNGPVADPTPQYAGTGSFETSNGTTRDRK